MANEQRPVEATAIRDIISGLQGAMKHLSTLATVAMGLVGALGVWEPGVRSSLLYVAGAILLLGSRALSLCALVLLSIMHVYIPDPGRSFVSDNKGTFAVVLITLGTFVVGLCLIVFAISFSTHSQPPRVSAGSAVSHANPPLQQSAVALGWAACWGRPTLGSGGC